jgi:hypothetical protein
LASAAADHFGRSHGRGLTTGQIILATMYHTHGIDPHRMLTDRLDRPVPLLPEGQPLCELVSV